MDVGVYVVNGQVVTTEGRVLEECDQDVDAFFEGQNNAVLEKWIDTPGYRSLTPDEIRETMEL